MGTGALKGAVEGAKDGFISGMMSGAVAGAMNPSFCFVAGTTVLTTLGKKAIETIQVGDTIPCVDHITGESAEKRVVTTTVNKVNRLIELDIDGEIIQCTETHPFQVKGRGWVNAADLKPGSLVYTKDWNTEIVLSVNLIELDEPVEVFNFEVEDCHTYFVGELYILVHNGPCTNSGGRHGGSKHRAKVNELKDELTDLGWKVSKTESRIPVGSSGKYRYPDITATKNGKTIFVQVGKAKQNGGMIAREFRAFMDLSEINPTLFFRYN